MSVDKEAFIHSAKDSKLCQLFQGETKLPKTADNRYFMDRDPLVFRHVLMYLQTNRKYLPMDVDEGTEKLIEKELKYWKLTDLNYERATSKSF